MKNSDQKKKLSVYVTPEEEKELLQIKKDGGFKTITKTFLTTLKVTARIRSRNKELEEQLKSKEIEMKEIKKEIVNFLSLDERHETSRAKLMKSINLNYLNDMYGNSPS